MSRQAGELETEPEAEPHAAKQRAARAQPGFVVVWSYQTPQHIGAWLPVGAVEGNARRVLGRGSSRPDDGCVRLTPVQQRPRANFRLEPFESPALSRVQLVIEQLTPETLSVRNVGRCRLVLNGREVHETQVRRGDLLEIGTQLVLSCDARASKMLGPAARTEHAFGRADAHGFVGESPAAWRLRTEVARVAAEAGHVLVLGASGTGKEVTARALHQLSGRNGALVARNAATLPESLVDAELFGNLKDYPNPGMPDRKGLVGAADGGTLFLDEFAELPKAAQSHLLRVLDDGEYQRLGETSPRRSRLRLIAATNGAEEALRPELRARFDFRIRLPKLDDRREDIPLVLCHLFGQIAAGAPDLCARFSAAGGVPRLTPAFVGGLFRHAFAGNVRELRSMLWTSLHQSTGSELDWPTDTASEPHEQPSPTSPDVEQIERVLTANGGSIEKSWRELGFSSRYALTRLLRKRAVRVTKQFG